MLQDQRVHEKAAIDFPLIDSVAVDVVSDAGAVPIAEIVRECIAQSGNNAIAADNELRRRMGSDQALYRAVMQKLESKASWMLIQKYIHEVRQRTWDVPNDDGGHGRPERVKYLAQANYEMMLMNFPLPLEGYPLLKDATKDMVLKAAGVYMAKAKDMVAKGKWLLRIAELLLDEKKSVQDQLKEDTLRKLQFVEA